MDRGAGGDISLAKRGATVVYADLVTEQRSEYCLITRQEERSGSDEIAALCELCREKERAARVRQANETACIFFREWDGTRENIKGEEQKHSREGAAACSCITSRSTQQLNTSRKLGLRSLCYFPR